MKLLARLWGNEEGVDAIEYALIAMFISIAAVAGMQMIGGNILATFNTLVAAF